MHLLGAAVGTRRDWRAIEPAVDGKHLTTTSRQNDKILSAVYRVAEAGTKAIGCEGIPTTSRKVKNVDVSRVVQVHQDHLRAVKLRSARVAAAPECQRAGLPTRKRAYSMSSGAAPSW